MMIHRRGTEGTEDTEETEGSRMRRLVRQLRYTVTWDLDCSNQYMSLGYAESCG